MRNNIEKLDANARQRRETFARYGLAMYHAQCVEKSLAILVSSVFNKEFLASDPNRREEIQGEVFAKTIGRLLTGMRKQISVPTNLDRTLTDALQKWTRKLGISQAVLDENLKKLISDNE